MGSPASRLQTCRDSPGCESDLRCSVGGSPTAEDSLAVGWVEEEARGWFSELAVRDQKNGQI